MSCRYKPTKCRRKQGLSPTAEAAFKRRITLSVTLIQEIGQATELKQALTDLDMSKILCFVDTRMKNPDAEKFMLQYFSSDFAEIENRMAALTDFKQLTTAQALQHAIDSILAIRTEEDKLNLAGYKLQDVLYRWRRMAAYVACIEEWNQLLAAAPVHSQRVKDLTSLFKELAAEPLFSKCKSILGEMETLLPLPRYLNLGFNAREDGYPSEMGILGTEAEDRPLNALLYHTDSHTPSEGLGPEFVYTRAMYGSHFDEYVMRGLEKEWKSTINKAAKLVDPVELPRSSELLALARPLQFYQVGLLCCEAFEGRGYVLCRPQAMQNTSLTMKNVHYPELILHNDGIMGNDLLLQTGHAVVITGANHSGKTSYLKTVGQSYMLAQLGFFVPAESMQFTPVTGIYTLFSAGEDSSMTASRMGVEIKKLTGILKEATATDLVLLNEPMTSTNPVEAVSICADLSRHFLQKGITHLLVTHLYDIYFLLKAQLTGDLRPKLESLITQSYYDESAGAMSHSYRLINAEPLGNSYARETATAYGITLEDMIPAGSLLDQAEAYRQANNINSIYEGDENNGLSNNH